MPLLRRITNLFRRNRLDREVEAELEAHLQARTEENIAAGMTESEARRDAMVRFGNLTATRERVAGADTALLLASVWSDVRFAGRQLRQNPGFAVTAVAVLAIGLGACVAIFAFVDAALIQPLPYRDPSRLVALFESMTLGARYHISYLDYLDWKRTNQVFAALDVYGGGSYTLATPSGMRQVDVAEVSDGFFGTLGVRPALGRDFFQGEQNPGAAHTVILSDAVWRERYGAAADVLGQAVTLSGTTYTIVGVLPAGFHFAPVADAGYWKTISTNDGCAVDRGCHNRSGVARLRDGVTVEQAAANMKEIADALSRQYRDADADRGATVLPLSDLIVGNLRPILLVLLSGAGVLLLIACVNVASLLLVRAESRRREIAIRQSVGASAGRLMRQLATEGVVLVAASALLGLGGARIAMRLMLALVPGNMMASLPYLQGIGFGPRVAEFAAAISIAACLLFSILPAVRLARTGGGTAICDALATGGRGFAGTAWRRFGSHLAAIELAMAMVLLVCAGLLGKSFFRLLHTSLGLDPERLVAVRVLPPQARYSDNTKIVALNREVIGRTARLPGVDATGTCALLPVGYNAGSTVFHVAGRPFHGEHVEVLDRSVDEHCFPAIGARILRGRNFTTQDDATHPPVAIINQAMSKRHFPGEDPVGQRVFYSDEKSPREIVGIVNDIKEGQLDDPTGPAIYLPFAQVPEGNFFVVARTSQDGQEALTSMAAAAKSIDPNIAIAQRTTMSERILDSPAAYLHRSSAWLVGGFAAAALLLSVVGLYGVIAYSVSQRTREIGVRMALGAERGAVYSLVMKEAALVIAGGAIAGMVCAVGAATLMRKLLFDTAPWDAATLAGVAAVLTLCALSASFLPAHRAASVNPVEALRAE